MIVSAILNTLAWWVSSICSSASSYLRARSSCSTSPAIPTVILAGTAWGCRRQTVGAGVPVQPNGVAAGINGRKGFRDGILRTGGHARRHPRIRRLRNVAAAAAPADDPPRAAGGNREGTRAAAAGGAGGLPHLLERAAAAPARRADLDLDRRRLLSGL